MSQKEAGIQAEIPGELGVMIVQKDVDGIPTFWISRENLHPFLRFLKNECSRPYRMLYDLFGVDERERRWREGLPHSSFTVVYKLLSLERNEFLRVKVPLDGEHPSVKSITDIWPSANWYEREVWDMFGVSFDRHPHLTRILLPERWEGHPLRKEHPARATEMAAYHLSEEEEEEDTHALKFRPQRWGLQRRNEQTDFLFLNLGPQHPGTHGVLRVVLQLDGEVILDAVPEIGFHHRAAEKMGERQSWHTYIPYTDRVEYLSGVLNNLPYVLAVERLAGIEVPERARVIRVMMCELFRIISHLVWYGTFAQDLGAMSPVFYTFNDRERAFSIVQALTGARMHPSWFRIGGVAMDLPAGWEGLFRDFLEYLPPRLSEYDKMVMQNRIFRKRTIGVGAYTREQAIEWGMSGPALRAAGVEWDLRKKQPYSGYEQFEFDVPTGSNGDCYDRASVHVEEMRQSLRIIEQCVNNMPAGDYKSRHPRTTPPIKTPNTMHDIETLIHHFLNVSWGPVIPPGECAGTIESSKGMYTYYLVSDGGTMSYRTRIRGPSFAHIQTVPMASRGGLVPDLIAILGSLDYVLSDVDR